MRWRSDLTLFLVALIWGSSFAAQRVANASMGPLTYNGLRILLGAGLLTIVAAISARRGRSADLTAGDPLRRSAWWVGVTGLLLFGASALQQVGMHYTTAGNAGFLTSLYVVLVPILLLGFYSAERWKAFRMLKITVSPADLPTVVTWGAVAVAGVGVFLLSGASLGVRPALSGGAPQIVGDVLELVGAVFWALHVILVGRLTRRMPVMPLMIGQFLISGALNLGLGLAFEPWSTGGVLQAGWAILYSGAFSIGVGFTLQAVGQRHAPPSDAALILSMEAVFAALAGYIFLGELLDPRQALGCGLIFGAILLAQFNRLPFLTERSRG
jgi:drug/metabolite transporter (DMT)-like permease